ncbi:MAG: dienelactone hydrolase family protein [Sandaracinaceae bacterium]|nr:dienelactone hydrolase family protein [Sandaracinaceae bacterium]
MVIRTDSIEYKAGDVALKGFVAWDDSVKGRRPAVLIVHEWWGISEHIREKARALAELGYLAFAVDMFGEGKYTEEPDEASKMMNEALADPDALEAKLTSALAAVRQREEVDGQKISIVGYCFGGAVAIFAARRGLEFRAAIAFHPGTLELGAPAKKGEVKAKVLALAGADDPMIPEASYEPFKKDLQDAGAEVDLVVYPNVTHAFTNKAATERGKKYGLPLAYDAHADADSWARMRELLASVS